jgi:hypothetical protein
VRPVSLLNSSRIDCVYACVCVCVCVYVYLVSRCVLECGELTALKELFDAKGETVSADLKKLVGKVE